VASPPLDAFVTLYVANNDTLETVPALLGELVPHKFVPNVKGYTILSVAYVVLHALVCQRCSTTKITHNRHPPPPPTTHHHHINPPFLRHLLTL
jgi:hypothetical protein